ncbi:MAG: helix-turn-helix domain-containing protein [Deltaproteobacteria bacterium]|nr:helix-turn-helix domain-containing protein [Deltaproteobacteria bacterium]
MNSGNENKPVKRHRIAVAIYNGLLGFEYSVAREILGRDRTELVPDWYEFLPCRVERGRLFSNHGLEIRPTGKLEDLARADTILIPGWRETLDRPAENFLEALRAANARGARLISICTGAFPLAHAGLLDHRAATTHWLHIDSLKRSFPKIQVEEDALYLHDNSKPGQISTSAGCAAGLDLCLAIVREDFGLSIANTLARRMVAPVHRDGGQAQYAEAPAGGAGDDPFGPVLDWLIGHLDQPLVVDSVARRFGFSLRTFQRRFKEVTALSPHQWLIRQRIAKARELLESSDGSIEQVATRSGLGSAANLRKHLAQHLGTTPRAYRSAFRAEP